jgi:hypothetical protein
MLSVSLVRRGRARFVAQHPPAREGAFDFTDATELGVTETQSGPESDGPRAARASQDYCQCYEMTNGCGAARDSSARSCQIVSSIRDSPFVECRRALALGATT